MTDPVYLKLKEDAGIVLKDLWRTLCQTRKPVQMAEQRPVAVTSHNNAKPSLRR